MNKQIARELEEYANKVAVMFSYPDREGNYNGETFTVKEIVPTSENTAIVTYNKSSGKDSVAFFYYLARGASKGWRYFFPTDSHILGFRAFEIYKLLVEKENYKFNFP